MNANKIAGDTLFNMILAGQVRPEQEADARRAVQSLRTIDNADAKQSAQFIALNINDLRTFADHKN